MTLSEIEALSTAQSLHALREANGQLASELIRLIQAVKAWRDWNGYTKDADGLDPHDRLQRLVDEIWPQPQPQQPQEGAG